MVTKQCAFCGRYFTGELNGDYACSNCAQGGMAAAKRPLSQLDLDQPIVRAKSQAA